MKIKTYVPSSSEVNLEILPDGRLQVNIDWPTSTVKDDMTTKWIKCNGVWVCDKGRTARAGSAFGRILSEIDRKLSSPVSSHPDYA